MASEVKSKAQRGLFKDNTPVSATPVISDPVDNPLDDEGYDGLVISPSSVFANISCQSMLIYVYKFALIGQRAVAEQERSPLLAGSTETDALLVLDQVSDAKK